MNSMPHLSYKENTTHGNKLLPFQYYYCTIPESYRELPMHWHEEMEITLISDGMVNYDIDFQSFQVTAGDILLIAPHILHSASIINDATMSSESIVFHLDMVGGLNPDSCTLKYFTPIANGKYKLPGVIKPTDTGYDTLKQCVEELYSSVRKQEPEYELALKERLFHFFYLLYKYNYVKKEIISSYNTYTQEKLKTILSYIQNNYSKQLTIQELANLCHFSEVHLMNFFKKYTGMTCIYYVNHYRLEVAASLLETSDTSITDIAMDCGFHNISYFNRLFKDKYNMTPKQYRRGS